MNSLDLNLYFLKSAFDEFVELFCTNTLLF